MGMIRRAVALFLSAALTFLCLSPALALTGTPSEEKVVRVGWYSSSFNRMDNFGRRSGYAYEYQMKIAAFTGWRYEYISGSWSELLQMLVQGEIDLMSDVSYTEDRAENMLFSSLPMGSEEYYLFVSRSNREISPSDYSTLNGKKVGVNRNSVQADFYRDWAARRNVQSVLVEVTGSEESSVNMLNTGELDAYVTVDSFALEDPKAQPVPICKIGSSDFYFAVNKTRPDLLTDLENAMNRILEENRYYNQQLNEKHLKTVGSSSSLSEEERAWLSRHGTIRVGYQDNYLAFCAADPETGALTGALKDYLEAASSCLPEDPLQFSAVSYPTASAALEALQQGEIDCMFPANLSAGEGEPLGIVMTPPIMQTNVEAVVRLSDRPYFRGREHVIVAVNLGNPNYESFLKNNYPSWRIVYYSSTEECLRKISEGVADCLLISSYRFSNISRRCRQLRLSTLSTSIDLDYSFAVRAGDTHLYSILSRAEGQISSSAVSSALSRYITEDAKPTVGDFIVEHLHEVCAVAVVIVLLILALMFRSMKAEKKAARLIAATETDGLTGLYNRDYFLEYAGRLRHEHPGRHMDAVVMNIDHFHTVNAMSGREFGDQVLQAMGSELRTVVKEKGGIAGRFGADRFDLYCPHQESYEDLFSRLQSRMNSLSPGAAGVSLRMGVMPWQVDLNPVQMFDRARTACSMARNNYQKRLIVYDNEMRSKELYEQRLLNDLHRALNSYEFEVHYQPQYDIQCDPPKFVGAEALVRWNHPDLGMIPPGDFIGLFERNGKIGEVDQFVWAEAARKVARWRDIYGITVPVSVNLSRADVFDPALESALDRLMAYNGLSQGSLRMEVTESAYTENADQVVRVVEGLRQKGYIVEMDDFGSGYSSLNMLSAMPVDVLKMDRAFIRRISESEKDRHLVALILGIAKNMKIPVVAEGVETEEQLRLLKELGCSLVQGFYFSRPLPAAEFETEVIRKCVH